MPTGRFTRKIQFQASRSVSTPPRSTPAVAPPDSTKLKTPIALARSAVSVKMVMMSESATTETIAPPKPCTARADDQELLRAGQSTGGRGGGEEADADEEQPAAAVEVAEAPAEQQEAAEGEQVGVHHPGERRVGEAEIALDRRQGDIDDRRVEDDQHVTEAEHVKRQPSPVALEGHSGGEASDSTALEVKSCRARFALSRGGILAGECRRRQSTPAQATSRSPTRCSATGRRTSSSCSASRPTSSCSGNRPTSGASSSGSPRSRA